nr:hypothetical protein [Tanacetum cinerariifolium]
MDQDQHPSGLGTQEQLEEFDTWLDGFRTDDDEVPNDKVSQELLEAMSGEINEAKLQKVVDEMLRQRCKSVEEHQYHVDQMQNYLKRLKKYTLSLHKFPVVPFPDDDMEGRTLRWVDKPLKKLNVYARYSVEHWKNMWAKQDHIKRQKQLRDNPHEVYSESKIAKIIRITYELGHDHKFITKIIVRRTNRKIDPITESYHKYLNKNDIEDMYLLCINENSKKEKRLMVHEAIQKFCDATLKRVLEGLEKYNKDMKYGYANPIPSKDHVELLRYYEEDIKECMKHQCNIQNWFLRREEDENFQDRIGGVLRSHIQKIIPSHVHMQVAICPTCPHVKQALVAYDTSFPDEVSYKGYMEERRHSPSISSSLMTYGNDHIVGPEPSDPDHATTSA